MKFKPITVDGEGFEYFAAIDAVLAVNADGELEDTKRSARTVVLQRAGSFAPGFALLWEKPTPPEEADIAALIRTHAEKLPKVEDPKWAAQHHAIALQVEWFKLPLFERIELSRVWLERWERRIGAPPAIKDPSNLEEISVKSQLAAHALGGDAAVLEERAAQDRDVREALARAGR